MDQVQEKSHCFHAYRGQGSDLYVNRQLLNRAFQQAQARHSRPSRSSEMAGDYWPLTSWAERLMAICLHTTYPSRIYAVFLCDDYHLLFAAVRELIGTHGRAIEWADPRPPCRAYLPKPGGVGSNKYGKSRRRTRKKASAVKPLLEPVCHIMTVPRNRYST